jgi:hypothetical protein
VSDANAAAGMPSLGFSLVTTKQFADNFGANKLDYIEKLYYLRQKGVLTEEEYLAKRQKALES